MTARRTWIVLVISALLQRTAPASPRLSLVAVARPEPTVTVELTATNDGDEPVGALRPELLFEHHTTAAPQLDRLAPGEHHTWTVALLPASGRGPFPVGARVEYQHVDATPASAVTVTTVATADAPPSGVRATLRTPPLTHVSNVTLVLENSLPESVGGRVAVVLPPPLFIEPASQPVEVAAGGRKEVPLVIERKNAPAGTLPVAAVFEFRRDGIQHTVLAVGSLEATAEGGAPRRPFWIGVSALGMALAAVAYALRRSAPGHRAI